MRVGRWDFTPGLWATLGTLVLMAVLIRLGFWQLARADEKAALYAEFRQRMQAAPVDLNTAPARADADAMRWRPVTVRGRFLPDANVLLDNQIMNDEVGYFVLTPFELEGTRGAVLVNRGWVKADPARRSLPDVEAPAGMQQLTGQATPPPPTGIALGEWRAEVLSASMIRVTQVDIARIAAQYRLQLLPYLVRLPPPAPPGWARDWRASGSGSQKHLAYAFQWFAMAAALLCIYIIVNSHKAVHAHG